MLFFGILLNISIAQSINRYSQLTRIQNHYFTAYDISQKFRLFCYFCQSNQVNRVVNRGYDIH